MANRAAWDREPHGTDARARRHRRDGDVPAGRMLRRVCPACADAEALARRYRADSRWPGSRPRAA